MSGFHAMSGWILQSYEALLYIVKIFENLLDYLFFSLFEVLHSYFQEFGFQDDSFVHTLKEFLCHVFLFHLPLMLFLLILFSCCSSSFVLPMILLLLLVPLHVVLLAEIHLLLCILLLLKSGL
jgi:hypothetical protein